MSKKFMQPKPNNRPCFYSGFDYCVSLKANKNLHVCFIDLKKAFEKVSGGQIAQRCWLNIIVFAHDFFVLV